MEGLHDSSEALLSSGMLFSNLKLTNLDSVPLSFLMPAFTLHYQQSVTSVLKELLTKSISILMFVFG